MLANGQAEAGATEFTGDGAIGLGKGLEQMFAQLLFNANAGIAHGDA